MTIADLILRLLSIWKPWYTVLPWEAAIRVRCGKWTKDVGPGFHVRLPVVDKVFRQCTRWRVACLKTQTIGQTVISARVRYRIDDVRRLYFSLGNGTDGILEMVESQLYREMSSLSESEQPPSTYTCSLHEYGIEVASVALTDLAHTRSPYRFITESRHHGFFGDALSTTQEVE